MANLPEETVIVLVKAIPQVGSKHGETVCCAGVTFDGKWRRLYPIKFRELKSDARFVRWQRLTFKSQIPKADYRPESRHVFSDTLRPGKPVEKPVEKANLIHKILQPSAQHAAAMGHTLTAVKPLDYKFEIKTRKAEDVAKLKAGYAQAVAQMSFLDEELKAYDPPPYHFRLSFTDASGSHHHECGDWETIATFMKWRDLYGEQEAIKRQSQRYNQEYREKGVVFALGTLKKRPKTWTLLGIIRVDEPPQELLL